MISKRSGSIAILLGLCALAFSIYFVLFYQSITNNILQIETESINSNTEIEANMISKIFVKSVESVVGNLRLISNSPSVQNGDSGGGVDLLVLAEHNTDNLTDFYVWLDSEGKIMGSSSAIDETRAQLAEDLSNAALFSIPNRTFSHYVSNITFFENIPRIFISFPVLDRDAADKINAIAAAAATNENIPTNVSTYATAGTFEGIIAAAIRVDELGEYLQNQIPPEYNGFVGVVNNRGTILSSANLSHIGKNIFDMNLNPIIPSQGKDSFNLHLNQSFSETKPRVQNMTYDDNKHISVGYQPLFFGQPNGDRFATLFVSSSHLATDEIASLMQQQSTFSISVYVIILLLATGLALVILFWNKKLKELVNKKTKELQKANQSLRIAYEQLKVNDKMQQDFINIAAHELRTPIQVIMGNAEIALSDPLYRAFDDKNGQFIKAISRNASRLHRLAEYILDAAMIESNLLKIKKEEFNIEERIKFVVDNFRTQQEATWFGEGYSPKRKKSIELDFVSHKDNPIMVEADVVRFEQIVSNLIDNAIKFIDSEVGKVTISVDVINGNSNQHNDVRQKNKVTISVKDNGRGIHPDMSHNLFRKFTSKAEFGTGLGLFISKSIIEAHGGTIWAKNNEEGKGATFSFSLPLKDYNKTFNKSKTM